MCKFTMFNIKLLYSARLPYGFVQPVQTGILLPYRYTELRVNPAVHYRRTTGTLPVPVLYAVQHACTVGSVLVYTDQF